MAKSWSSRGHDRKSFLGLLKKLPPELQKEFDLLIDSIVFKHELEEWVDAAEAVDHGALGGLSDDDHTQYHNDSRANTWLATKNISSMTTDTLANYNAKISDATLYEWEEDQGGTDIHANNVPDGADATAIHDNVAGEINAISEKTTPAGGDWLIIEDSADSNNKKKVQVTNMPDCPTYKYIKATTQSEGDLHLSDGSTWGISKSLIVKIRVDTASTDWDLWLLQNDNGYAANDANVPAIQLNDAGNGSETLFAHHPYEDEDASGEIHLYLIDNSGANTFDVYILGYELK